MKHARPRHKVWAHPRQKVRNQVLDRALGTEDFSQTATPIIHTYIYIYIYICVCMSVCSSIAALKGATMGVSSCSDGRDFCPVAVCRSKMDGIELGPEQAFALIWLCGNLCAWGWRCRSCSADLDQPVGRLAGHPAGRPTDWPAAWPASRVASWLASRPTSWIASLLASWLVTQLASWSVAQAAGWLASQQAASQAASKPTNRPTSRPAGQAGPDRSASGLPACLPA